LSAIALVIILSLIPTLIGLYFIVRQKKQSDAYLLHGEYEGTEMTFKKTTRNWIIFGVVSAVISLLSAIPLFFFAYLTYRWRGPGGTKIRPVSPTPGLPVTAGASKLGRGVLLALVGGIIGGAVGYLTRPYTDGTMFLTSGQADQAVQMVGVHMMLSIGIGLIVGVVLNFLVPAQKAA
jgi:hypothetical protein